MHRLAHHLTFILLWLCTTTVAQVIPPERITDWSSPGSRTPFVPTVIVDISDHGADPTGILPNGPALQAAMAALGGPGEVYFPEGVYFFNSPVVPLDSIILQGAADPLDNTPLARLVFSTGENLHGILVAGTEQFLSASITAPLAQGDQTLTVDDPGAFAVGDVLRLHALDDVPLLNDSWAYHHTGQIVEVVQVEGNTLVLDRPLRRTYSIAPSLIRMIPRRQVHVRCLAIDRQDATTTQTANVHYSNAMDCTFHGVVSRWCNYAHINIFRSYRITVANSFFKDAHAYGSGGKGYGVLIDYASADCFVHQNNFEHLRHAMLLQAGANGNVLAYNRSVDPFWSSFPLPSDAAGDLVLHGNYPYMNLMEGNMVQNIVIDNSHFINGPYNTFFRNRAGSYGIFMNTSPPSNDQNFIGNQVTNTSGGFYGQYALQGTGHFAHGNQIKGTILPMGTTEPSAASLFDYPFPSFYSVISAIPPIRTDNWQSTAPLVQAQYNGQILDRPATCTDSIFDISTIMDKPTVTAAFRVYPIPARDELVVELPAGDQERLYLLDAMGREVYSTRTYATTVRIDLSRTAPGIYVLFFDGHPGHVTRILKE